MTNGGLPTSLHDGTPVNRLGPAERRHSSSSGADRTSAKRRVTIREVANLAQVSLGTVSNVLNNPLVVAPATRKRVLDAIDSTRFVRNTAAHQLRVGKSRTIGVVLLDIANPFFTEIVRGAEHVLREQDYVLMLCSTDESAKREQRYFRVLEEHRVDGILVCPVDSDLESAAGTRGFRHPDGAAGPGRQQPRAVLRGGGRHPGRRTCRRPSLRAGAPGDRAGQRPGDDPAVHRPEGRRSPVGPAGPLPQRLAPRDRRGRSHHRSRRGCGGSAARCRAPPERGDVRQRPSRLWGASGARRSWSRRSRRDGRRRLRRRGLRLHVVALAQLCTPAQVRARRRRRRAAPRRGDRRTARASGHPLRTRARRACIEHAPARQSAPTDSS